MWIRLIVILFLAAYGQVCLAGPTGRQIVEEQKNRHSADNETSEITLVLADRKGKEKQQKMRLFSMNRDDRTKSLIQYLSPPNIRGVGLLTWENGGEAEDDQWLYMSAARSVKRIAGGGKKNQFMGTDMAFEDLRPENLETHTYTLIEETEFAGAACWKVEALPSTEKEQQESGYGRRIMWVDKATYMTVNAEFYDHHGRLIKTARFEEIRPVKDQIYRSYKITWRRVRQKTQTTMVYDSIDLSSAHAASRFTQSFLKRPVTP